jgi:hypothetical protein
MDDRHRERTLAFLSEHHLIYVCVDEPQGFRSSVPPVAASTADLAAVRFHGRNTEAWEAPGKDPALRTAYDYRDDELAEWMPRIATLHEARVEKGVLPSQAQVTLGASKAPEHLPRKADTEERQHCAEHGKQRSPVDKGPKKR